MQHLGPCWTVQRMPSQELIFEQLPLRKQEFGWMFSLSPHLVWEWKMWLLGLPWAFIRALPFVIHTHQHCGAEVDSYGLHGLSCKWSQGHLHWHTAINSIVHEPLAAAQVPSRLEPSGIIRSDGKRPGGVTLVPWISRRMKGMGWDVTCPDTFAVCYQFLATTEAGMVAARAEENNEINYSNLDTCYSISSLRLCEIRHTLRETTMDDMAFTYFLHTTLSGCLTR